MGKGIIIRKWKVVDVVRRWTFMLVVVSVRSRRHFASASGEEVVRVERGSAQMRSKVHNCEYSS